MKEDSKANDALNTMPSIQFKLEDEIKSQLQDLISEFFMSYRGFLPWDRGDDYFIPQNEAPAGFNNYPYEYFMRNLKWSDNMINDVANCLLQQLLNRFTDLDIQSRMADDIKVLLDDEMSKRWLCRIAKAERTSVAYERSMRLIGDGKNIYHNVIAREILQKAADTGDESSAMFLIGKQFDQHSRNDSERNELSSQCAYGVVYAEIGDTAKAKECLQRLADSGDEESAMFLISQTISQNSQSGGNLNKEEGKEVKPYKGLYISWDQEKILEFLLKRYDKSDARAEHLLAQHLKKCVDAQIGEQVDKLALRKQKVKEVRGYPLTVIQKVLDSDFCNEIIQKTSDGDSDMPF